jgi:hypothetical protein
VIKKHDSLENLFLGLFYSYFESTEQWSWFNTSDGYGKTIFCSSLLDPFIKGWNSWNHFGCNINEKLIQQTADLIVSTGLAAAGYEYGLFSSLFFQSFLLFFFDLSSQSG